MTLRKALEKACEGLPDEATVGLPVGWLRERLEEDGEREELDPLFDVEEVAERFDRCAATVRSWCQDGRLPGAYKLRGRTWRIPASAVRKFEREQAEEDRRPPALGHGREVDLGGWREERS